MTAPRQITPPVIFKAVAVVMLILSLAFALFGVGFFIEGQFDLADGRMDGHASLDLSEAVALHWFWRRIQAMFGFSAVLLAGAAISAGIAASMKRQPPL